MAELQPGGVLGQPSDTDISIVLGKCIKELMNGINAGVTAAERAQLRKFLQEFGGILSLSD